MELIERHQQVLRLIVKAIRDQEIPEEFFVALNAGSLCIRQRAGSAALVTPLLSRHCLDVLEKNGFLHCSVTYRTDNTIRHRDSAVMNSKQEEASRICSVTPEGYRAVDSNFAAIPNVTIHQVPVEITDSLARFRAENPNFARTAFVMMQFAQTPAHKHILAAIRNALQPHGWAALRADDKQYHDDLYNNILTYMHGCQFGIAVFERIQEDNFNPNVSLEVGYTLGLGKSVCLLLLC